MENLLEQKKLYVLYALSKMGSLTPLQLSRFLFDTDIVEQFDLQLSLTELKEAGLLKQAVSLGGIVYGLTEDGEKVLNSNAAQIPADKKNKIEEESTKYRKLFLQEKDYLAQYTEQANAIVPVFLSLRDGDRILMKVSVIVPDIPTAKRFTKNWMKNAHKTYEAVWESISDGEHMPNFK